MYVFRFNYIETERRIFQHTVINNKIQKHYILAIRTQSKI